MEPNSVILPMVSVSLKKRRRMRSLWQPRFEKLHARSCQQGHLCRAKMENPATNDVHLGKDGPAAAGCDFTVPSEIKRAEPISFWILGQRLVIVRQHNDDFRAFAARASDR